MGVDAPTRPVAEKVWLKPTGPLPRAGNPGSSTEPVFDARSASDGGCDSPNHFEGCRVIFIKVRGERPRSGLGMARSRLTVDLSRHQLHS